MSAALKLLSFPLTGERSPLLAGPVAGTSQPARAALIDSADQAQAEGRLQIVQALLQYDRDPRPFAHYRLADGTPVTSKSLFVEYLCDAHDVCRATLFNWQKAFREGGLPALADRQRSDRGQSRWFANNEKAAWAAAYLGFECRQSTRAVFESLCEDRDLLNLTDLPSYATVQRFLKSAPEFLRAYAIEGRRAYEERMAPYLQRGYTDLAPNQAWCADGASQDVYVFNDCFAEAEWGARVRLRITGFEDYRSRYIVGTSWSLEESSRSIGSAFLRALSKYAPPELVQFDNGKAFRKASRGAKRAAANRAAASEIDDIERLGIVARIGAKITHCLPYHGQAKPIERFFGTLHNFDKMFYQHYSGPAPHLRPDAASAEIARHARLQTRGRVDQSTLPRASFFIALCMEWIEEYHNRPHRGAGMDGATPAEVFAERPAAAPVSNDALALLLQERTRLKVRECAVEWTPVPKGGKRRYTFFDEASRDTLHALNDTEVIVAWDPNDLDAVAILDQRGHFLAWAKAQQYLRMDPADPETQASIARLTADRRHLQKSTRGALETISRNARAIGVRTPIERLAARPRLVPVIEAALTQRTPKPKPSDDARAPKSAAEIAADFLRSE